MTQIVRSILSFFFPLFFPFISTVHGAVQRFRVLVIIPRYFRDRKSLPPPRIRSRRWWWLFNQRAFRWYVCVCVCGCITIIIIIIYILVRLFVSLQSNFNFPRIERKHETRLIITIGRLSRYRVGDSIVTGDISRFTFSSLSRHSYLLYATSDKRLSWNDRWYCRSRRANWIFSRGKKAKCYWIRWDRGCPLYRIPFKIQREFDRIEGESKRTDWNLTIPR